MGDVLPMFLSKGLVDYYLFWDQCIPSIVECFVDLLFVYLEVFFLLVSFLIGDGILILFG